VKVRLAHGFAETTEGYVLPLRDGRWRPVNLAGDGVTRPLDPED
jgi:hypothetical protein